MNETVKLIAFDIVVVLVVTLVAGALLGLTAGFENVNWFAVFIGAVAARIVSIIVFRRLA